MCPLQLEQERGNNVGFFFFFFLFLVAFSFATSQLNMIEIYKPSKILSSKTERKKRWKILQGSYSDCVRFRKQTNPKYSERKRQVCINMIASWFQHLLYLLLSWGCCHWQIPKARGLEGQCYGTAKCLYGTKGLQNK